MAQNKTEEQLYKEMEVKKKRELIKEKLFPGNGLQERHDNFIPLFMRYGLGILDLFIEELNPLEERFLVISLGD